MPRLTITAFDPIEIVIGEKVYVIESISAKLLGELQSLIGDFEKTSDADKVERLTGVLMKVLPGISRDDAEKIDIRHVMKIAEFFADQVAGAGEMGAGKN